VEPTGKFAYAANTGGPFGTISGYAIDPTTGVLTGIGGAMFPPGTGPGAIAVDPTGKFAYTANFNSNDVSGFAINPTTGALTAVSGSPFAAGTGARSVAIARP
jgi:DNA-binding beta-propeller fold protein YncE